MLVDGGKMSKSLGNTYTLDQLDEMGYSPMVFRYFCLNAHYRQKLNFTFDGMDAAKKSLKNLKNQIAKHKGADGNVSDEELAKLLAEFEDAINDDLNIPKALGAVWNMARYETKSNKIYELILRCDSVLGIDLDKEEVEEEEAGVDAALDAEIKEQIALRAEAKKAKNYAEADRIRNELAARGITLTDTKEGTTYTINK